MASSKEYLNFILEQLTGLEEISYKAMMGEYILYYRGKIIGGIYDDRLLVKPVKSAVSLMPNAFFELPYEGAKEMLMASDVDGSPFENWTIILFPYATGDFHAGAGEFTYTDTDGKEKILYHNGYINYTETMKQVIEKAGVDDPDAVIVTGYSAGGFAAALLADDVFTNYYPDASSKNVLVDASLLLNEDWHDIAVNVWHTPKSISGMLVSDNLTLDCFRALHEKYGDNIHLLFDSSTRDGDLAKVQNYFDTGVMDVEEAVSDIYQQILKKTIPEFQDAGVSLFIWDGVAWYDDSRNMTAHTIIATPTVWLPFEEQGQSVAGWLADAIDGNMKDYGSGQYTFTGLDTSKSYYFWFYQGNYEFATTTNFIVSRGN